MAVLEREAHLPERRLFSGLATVHAIIAKHEGHITVRSMLGVGTTFSVYLPGCAGAQPAESAIGQQLQTGSGRILVMDDEYSIPLMAEYRLVVGVLGIVFDEESKAEAKRQFDLFVQKSKNARSAEAGTSVTLFKNHEIIPEYRPPQV